MELLGTATAQPRLHQVSQDSCSCRQADLVHSKPEAFPDTAKSVALLSMDIAGLLCCAGMALQSAVSPEDPVLQPSAPGSGEGSFCKGSGQEDGQGPLPAGMQQQRAALTGCIVHDRRVSDEKTNEAEISCG